MNTYPVHAGVGGAEIQVIAIEIGCATGVLMRARSAAAAVNSAGVIVVTELGSRSANSKNAGIIRARVVIIADDIAVQAVSTVAGVNGAGVSIAAVDGIIHAVACDAIVVSA